jgi:hypothetical protein
VEDLAQRFGLDRSTEDAVPATKLVEAGDDELAFAFVCHENHVPCGDSRSEELADEATSTERKARVAQHQIEVLVLRPPECREGVRLDDA